MIIRNMLVLVLMMSMNTLPDKALNPWNSKIRIERELPVEVSAYTGSLYSATIAIKFTAPRFSGGWWKVLGEGETWPGLLLLEHSSHILLTSKFLLFFFYFSIFLRWTDFGWKSGQAHPLLLLHWTFQYYWELCQRSWQRRLLYCWQALVVMLWSGGSDEGIDGGLERGVLEGELVMGGRCQYYWLTLSAPTKPPDDEAATSAQPWWT